LAYHFGDLLAPNYGEDISSILMQRIGADWISAMSIRKADHQQLISPTCAKLINKTISIDMTQDMVRLSLGKPAQIDGTEVTPSSKKVRWVYGIRGQAAYIWFKDGKVTKIKGSGS
jgi:hypothetical protein